jgi:hypothetical protein
MNAGIDAEITVDEAVDQALKNVFLPLTEKDNGRFIRYSGGDMPW